MDRWLDGWREGYMNGWIDGWMDARMDGQTDGQIHRQIREMNEQTCSCFIHMLTSKTTLGQDHSEIPKWTAVHSRETRL